MRKIIPLLLTLLFALGAFVLPIATHAATVAGRVSGDIVLDVFNNGEAWYVYPGNERRFYLGRPDDAFDIMRFLGLGITNTNLDKIPTNTESDEGDLALRQRLSGYILLQVEEHGEAWYVYPGDLKRYYLGRPSDAFAIMTNLGLGITPTDLAQIPISEDFLNITNPTEPSSSVQSFTLTIPRGSFSIDVVTISRNGHTMITDTAELSDCANNCEAHSLTEYIAQNNAEFAIHGTYFCPPDYSACSNEINSYFSPVYNTAADVMINEKKLPFHFGPMIVADTSGEYYYFHRTKDFGYTVKEFEEERGVQVQAAIANYPSLVENGSVIVESESLASNQTTKAVRGGFGYNDDTVFMVIAHSASVIDLGYIMEALGADWALNLDGGGSASLFANGSYVYQGGRQLPNAILFK